MLPLLLGGIGFGRSYVVGVGEELVLLLLLELLLGGIRRDEGGGKREGRHGR